MRPALPLLFAAPILALALGSLLQAQDHGHAHPAPGQPGRYQWIEVTAGDRALLDTATGRLLRLRANASPPHVEETDLVAARVRLRPLKTICEEQAVEVELGSPGEAARTVYRAVSVGDAATFYRCLAPALAEKHRGDFNWWFAELQVTWGRANFEALFDGKRYRFGEYEGKHLLDEVE